MQNAGYLLIDGQVWKYIFTFLLVHQLFFSSAFLKAQFFGCGNFIAKHKLITIHIAEQQLPYFILKPSYFCIFEPELMHIWYFIFCF